LTAVGANPGASETIVLGPLLGVGEYLISFVDLLEFIFRAFALVPVWMKLHGLFAKGSSNLLFIVGSGYSQSLIEVLIGHAMSPTVANFNGYGLIHYSAARRHAQ